MGLQLIISGFLAAAALPGLCMMPWPFIEACSSDAGFYRGTAEVEEADRQAQAVEPPGALKGSAAEHKAKLVRKRQQKAPKPRLKKRAAEAARQEDASSDQKVP